MSRSSERADAERLEEATGQGRTPLSHGGGSNSVEDEMRGGTSGADPYRADQLAKTISGQLDQRMAVVTDSGRADSVSPDLLVKSLGEQLSQQIEALVSNRPDAIDTERLAKTVGEQIDQRIAVLADKTPPDAEMLVKAIGEQLDHRIEALTAKRSADSTGVARSAHASG